LATFWMTLFATWLLAERCYASQEARCGAVALLAVWMTLPIAGTSLMLMDPYVTARSLSTPCVLLGLVGALKFLLPRFEMEEDTARDRRMGLTLCCAALACAGVMHPLMGAYGFGVLLLFTVLSRSWRVRVRGTMGLALTAVAMAAGMQLSAPAESQTYKRVVM